MSGLIDLASGILIAAGSAFILAGALGLVRMPDLFARIHGASLIDTMGAGLMIGGMMLQAGWSLVTLKLLFILAIFFFTLPVAAHALAQAALHEGLTPRLADEETDGGGRDKAADRS